MSIDSPRVVTVGFLDSARDPRAFIGSLANELEAALPGVAIHYHHADHGIEVIRNAAVAINSAIACDTRARS